MLCRENYELGPKNNKNGNGKRGPKGKRRRQRLKSQGVSRKGS